MKAHRANMNDDTIQACLDLVGRTGATDFEIGYVHDDVPVEKAGWFAQASYGATRVIVEDQTSPSLAAMALAERVLAGGGCKCGQRVTLSSDAPGCRWRLMGAKWVSGCDAPAMTVKASRGDIAAMQRAYMKRQNRQAARRGRSAEVPILDGPCAGLRSGVPAHMRDSVPYLCAGGGGNECPAHHHHYDAEGSGFVYVGPCDEHHVCKCCGDQTDTERDPQVDLCKDCE